MHRCPGTSDERNSSRACKRTLRPSAARMSEGGTDPTGQDRMPMPSKPQPREDAGKTKPKMDKTCAYIHRHTSDTDVDCRTEADVADIHRVSVLTGSAIQQNPGRSSFTAAKLGLSLASSLSFFHSCS
ncbi:hypothetical protein BDP81DRAFT_425297 [Colletotrichum phormii]|uniref:Uncharacterized protein n=1 Tax=Colletotrichum phormii TaxID=359342 RepID=A0AAJ0EI08_9PEZI|nr:uncharacterized protein BDP81DRAFT_425297 [Colletotrichum phormii]KAK1637480.1 hypothetical protein BDP81DRAFT_425297 [Colletotrichum phormii]